MLRNGRMSMMFSSSSGWIARCVVSIILWWDLGGTDDMSFCSCGVFCVTTVVAIVIFLGGVCNECCEMDGCR